MKFEIPGKAVGKARPRMCKNGHVYTPGKTVKYESLVALAYRESAGNSIMTDTAIEVDIFVYETPPKSMGKKLGYEAAFNGYPITKKPDLDNIMKCICDALNGIAYRDDAQIARAHIEKRYGMENKTVVEINWFEL